MTWNKSLTLHQFSINYKDALCKEGQFADAETPDPNEYERDCEFPTLNKGWNDQAEYEEGDCSLQYSEVIGSQYMIKCTVYFVASLIPFLASLKFFKQVHEARVAKGAKKINLVEKMFICNIGFTFCNMLAAIDMDSIAGDIGIIPHAFFVGIGIGCVLFTMIQLVVTWVSILNTRGKVQVVPPWLIYSSRISIVLGFIGEAIFGCFEYLPFLLPDAATKNHYGTFSGTCNSIKNGIIGVIIIFWVVVALRAGLNVSKKLKEGGADSGSKEIQKIGKFCKAIAVAAGAGAVYKFLFIPFRVGKAVQMDYPCGGGGWVSPVGLLMTLISWAVTIAQKPASGSKVTPGKAKSGTSTTVAKSEA